VIHYLVLDEVLKLHQRLIEQSGGTSGIRDLGGLESALAQPQMTFSGQELYPTIAEKASALGFSLIMNHPFLDGNKRIGHASMEVFLVLNNFEIQASVDEQEQVVLRVASGEWERDEFTKWLRDRIVPA
jgi:death on curing protein